MRGAATAAILAAGLTACAPRPAPAGAHDDAPANLPVRAVRVLAVHPHDPRAYTQGLVFHAGRLYESLGLEGRSALREVELGSGRVLREVALAPHEFGEGLTLAGDQLVQLTWRNGVAHRWRLADLTSAGEHRYQGEGWGLAFDGRRMIQSDGSATLTFRATEDFSPIGTLRVHRDGRPAPYLNELEFADGALYANLWQSDEIVRIDLANGEVTAVWSTAGLLTEAERAGTDVLNGIAWNPGARRFYLTGKLWPKLFEVELPLD